jgi:hypothetical protein
METENIKISLVQEIFQAEICCLDSTRCLNDESFFFALTLSSVSQMIDSSRTLFCAINFIFQL